MRKKISNILLGILLIFAGLFVSACGDKYKDFEFKISYAFSESAETWYDAKNGINLNYSLDEETDEYGSRRYGKGRRCSFGTWRKKLMLVFPKLKLQIFYPNTYLKLSKVLFNR